MNKIQTNIITMSVYKVQVQCRKDWISKSLLFMYINYQTRVKWCPVFIQVNYSLDCTAMDSELTNDIATSLWMVLAPAI